MLRLVALVPAAFSLLACSHQPPTAKAPPTPLATEYRTIAPDVSVSRNAQAAPDQQASVDPNSDVMAEILAIPAGR